MAQQANKKIINRLFFNMSLADNYKNVLSGIHNDKVTLVAVSKTHSEEKILEVYEAGCRNFGENKVQEMEKKAAELPDDILWHFVGHLQTNKVKYIAGFVHLVHSVENLKLLVEINKHAAKNNRVVNCLLEMFIAREESKFGLSLQEAVQLLNNPTFKEMKNVKIVGLMGMASNTEDKEQVRKEFRKLKGIFDKIKIEVFQDTPDFNTLSMGMTGDYKIAVEEGSTMVRVGTAIFGERDTGMEGSNTNWS